MIDWTEWVGTVAGVLTTIAFVPQVVKTWRSRRADDLSLPMLLMFVTGLALWLAYGLLKGSFSLVMANTVTLLLAGFVLGAKLRWR